MQQIIETKVMLKVFCPSFMFFFQSPKQSNIESEDGLALECLEQDSLP